MPEFNSPAASSPISDLVCQIYPFSQYTPYQLNTVIERTMQCDRPRLLNWQTTRAPIDLMRPDKPENTNVEKTKLYQFQNKPETPNERTTNKRIHA